MDRNQKIYVAAGVAGAALLGYILYNRSQKSPGKDTEKQEEAKVDSLPTRSAGGLELPVIGVGSWSFGGSKDDYWGAQETNESEKVIAHALKSGLTYFDTATMYNAGESERALGAALKKLDRDNNAVVGTKVYLPDDTASEESVRKNCEESLARLGVDCVDLYMVHWPVPSEKVKEVFDTLAALQKEGKIKHIGVSNFGVKQLTEALDTGVKISVNQLMYNLVSRGIEIDVMPLCQKNDIGIIAYSPLLQGFLTGKYESIDAAPFMRTRTRHFRGDREKSRHGGPGAEKEMWDAITEIKKIAEELNVSMSELSIAWCIANPAVTCVIPGARNIGQLTANYNAGRLQLSEETVSRLNKATDPVLEALGDKIDYYEGDDGQRSY